MMKKNFPKILAGCTAMVLMTGALLVPSMAVNASAIRRFPISNRRPISARPKRRRLP